MSEPKKPARVSNAPPPITPIRGGAWAPPKLQPARWQQVWQLMPRAALWQAVCLSLDIEPDEHLKDDATRARSQYSRLPVAYWDRLMVCQSNLSVNGPIRPYGQLYPGMFTTPFCAVMLPEVAAFAIKCGWTLPPAMRGLLHPEAEAPLLEPGYSPAAERDTAKPVGPGVTGPAPLKTGAIADAFSCVTGLKTKLGDLANHQWLIPARVDKNSAPAPSTWDPVRLAGLLIGRGQGEEELNKAFLEEPALKPWLSNWQESRRERNAFGR